MNEGQIEQIGAPQEVYDSPTSIYVADFLGLANLMPARVPTAGTVEIEGHGLAAPTGTVIGECTVVARPERLRVVPAGEGLLSGSVTDVIFVGSMTHIRVAVAERELQIVIANDGDTRVPVPGATVGIDIPPDAVRLLPC
jgi:ABC-type Fe3+/spermidine/putrescine transport system ATPase subunit